MFGFNRSRFGKRSSRAGLVRSSLGLEVLEGLALPSAVLPVPDAGPEVAAEVRQDYSAIVFVGGWGASSYQYAFNDPAPAGGVNVLMVDGSVRFIQETIDRSADDVVVDGRIITGENWDTARAGDARPTDQFSLNFTKIEFDTAPAAPSELAAEDAPQAAHVDYFLKLDGIDGESTSANSGYIKIKKLNSGG